MRFQSREKGAENSPPRRGVSTRANPMAMDHIRREDEGHSPLCGFGDPSLLRFNEATDNPHSSHRPWLRIVSRHAVSRAVRFLESRGLIEVDRQAGRLLAVTVLEIPV